MPLKPSDRVKSAPRWSSRMSGNRAWTAFACVESAPLSESTEWIDPPGPRRSASARVKAPVPDPSSSQVPPGPTASRMSAT